LNVAPAADALARLRVFDHRILAINLVLRLKVVRVGGGPVAIQSCSDIVVFHLDSPFPPLRVASPAQQRAQSGPCLLFSSVDL
jgi:hypothetical protein